MKNILVISLLTVASTVFAGESLKLDNLRSVLSSEGLTPEAFVLFAYAKGKASVINSAIMGNSLHGKSKDARKALVSVFSSHLVRFETQDPEIYKQLLTEKDPIAWINLVAQVLTPEEKAPMVALVQAAEKEREKITKRDDELIRRIIASSGKEGKWFLGLSPAGAQRFNAALEQEKLRRKVEQTLKPFKQAERETIKIMLAEAQEDGNTDPSLYGILSPAGQNAYAALRASK